MNSLSFSPGRRRALLALIEQATTKETHAARLAARYMALAAKHQAVRRGLEALLPGDLSGNEPVYREPQGSIFTRKDFLQ